MDSAKIEGYCRLRRRTTDRILWLLEAIGFQGDWGGLCSITGALGTRKKRRYNIEFLVLVPKKQYSSLFYNCFIIKYYNIINKNNYFIIGL